MAEQSVYTPPAANLAAEAGEKVYPGFRRLPYFGWSMAVQVAYAILAGVTIAVGSTALYGILTLGMFAAAIYVLVQRLHNLGSNPWWAAAMLVPLLNIYIGLKAMAFPEGYDDHKQLDGPAKVIIGLFVGIFVLGIAAALMIPAVAG
jgi:uncharacterized membrane protein YhaH (DUF805 family)